MNSVISLTQDLVRIQSVSRDSNDAVSNFIQEKLEAMDFVIERLTYRDENDQLKVNLVAKLGDGHGGLALCSHSDTVPGQEADWPAFDPVMKNGRLYGRGSCDMKGPLAATMIAASQIDPAKLKKPVYIVVTADEETGLLGAKYVTQHSQMLKNDKPQYGIIAEPTTLIPIYAHKGGVQLIVTSYGVAAHSSMDTGISANFQLARFMADMTDLKELAMKDERFMDQQFNPPTNGFNMTMTDFNTAGNVTAPKAQCKVGFRAMPKANNDLLLQMMIERAKKYELEYSARAHEPLLVSTASPLVKSAVKALNGRSPETVPYGTDGIYLKNVIPEMVVLGPGDIAVAHTIEESIPLNELETAVDVYRQIIEELCC